MKVMVKGEAEQDRVVELELRRDNGRGCVHVIATSGGSHLAYLISFYDSGMVCTAAYADRAGFEVDDEGRIKITKYT